jgi:hypothetical protein
VLVTDPTVAILPALDDQVPDETALLKVEVVPVQIEDVPDMPGGVCFTVTT